MTHLNDISKTYLEQIAKEGVIADRLKAMAAEKKKDWDKKGEEAVADANKAMDKVKKTQKDMESSSFVRTESKKLDPVGQEDADIDNDGDVDKSDKYLHKKRKAIGKAISKKKDKCEKCDEDPCECDDKKVEEGVVVTKRKTLGSRFKNEAERQAYLKKLDQKTKEKRLNRLRAAVEEVEEVEEVEQIDELRVTKFDKSKVKERAKNIRSIRDKKAQLADLMKHYKGMKSGIYNSYEPEGDSVDEKIDVRKQSSKRKSLGRGSSINPDAKKTGYESPAEFRKTEKELAPYMEAKNVHGEVEVPSGNIAKLAKKASKRIDTDVDGDVEHNDKHKGEYGEFVPSPDGKGRTFTGPKKVRKESFSNWRQDLIEVIDGEKSEKSEKIKEMSKGQTNKITINPKLGEAVEDIGGTLIEMIELDEFDFVLESVYDELIEEGYSEDDVEEAIEFALTEELSEASDKYYDSAVKASKKADAKIKRAEFLKKAKGRLRYLGRKVREKKSAAKLKSAQAQVAAYNKGRDIAQTAGDKVRRAKKAVTDVPKKAKSGIKAKIRKTAQKVVDRMS